MVKAAIMRLSLEFALTCHPLHYPAGQPKIPRSISKPLNSPVSGDAVDVTLGQADIPQLPLVQVTQAGSQLAPSAAFLKGPPVSLE